MLKDSSKYGTFVNNVKITQPTQLNDGDEVLFGTHSSVFRVCYCPLVVVASCLENSKKRLLKKQIHSIGGHLVNEWQAGHVTHLVMDGLVFTIKVIHALAECCPIVTPNWFDETLKAIDTRQIMPTPKMFLPPLKEESIKLDGPLFLPNKKRRTLFSGKTFYILSQKQFKRMHEAIQMCCGNTILLELSDDLLNDSRLVNDDCCLMMMDQKERDSLSIVNKKYVSQIMEYLNSEKRRPIPESELGLAILKMNQTNYCNPNIDAVPTITQNIVCQSLNVGLDEMSQIYSPQHRHPVAQFTRPSTCSNDKHETSHSSSTMTEYVQRSTDTMHSGEARRISVKDTPEGSMNSNKPKEVMIVSPIPETLNISDEDNIFLAAIPTKHSSKHTTNENSNYAIPDSVEFGGKNGHGLVISCPKIDKITTKDTGTFPDSLRLDSSVFESENNCRKNYGDVSKNGCLQKSGKQMIIDSDSVRIKVSESEPRVTAPYKEIANCRPLLSTSKLNREFGRIIPDSLGLDTETNDISTEKDDNRMKSIYEQAIADSMDIDWNDQPIANSNNSSEISGNSQRLGFKRRRMTEGEKEYQTPAVKKVKNFAIEHEDNSGEGFVTSRNEKKRRSNFLISPHEIRKTLKGGFLSARTLKKETFPGEHHDLHEDLKEDDYPKNLVMVDMVSLVVRKSGEKKTTTMKAEVKGKNFKKFKKQWYAGCNSRFPKIIGGSDLIVNQALSHAEQEDWFVEAREASQEQRRRNEIEEQLFMSDAGLPQRRRKR